MWFVQFFQCCAIFSRARIQSLKFFDAKQNNYFERPKGMYTMPPHLH